MTSSPTKLYFIPHKIMNTTTPSYGNGSTPVMGNITNLGHNISTRYHIEGNIWNV